MISTAKLYHLDNGKLGGLGKAAAENSNISRHGLPIAKDGSAKFERLLEHYRTLKCRVRDLDELLQLHVAENEQLNSQIDLLGEKIRYLESRMERASVAPQLSGPSVPYIAVLQSLPDVLKLAGQLFASHAVVAENAFKTATDIAKKQPFWKRAEGLAIAWEMMNELAHKVAPLFLDPNRSGDLEAIFNESSRFELAMSEGKTTKGNGKLMAQRVLSHDGQSFDMTPHLKYGNRVPKLLRIHFAIDSQNRRLIVGHCGEHIENATSRKRG